MHRPVRDGSPRHTGPQDGHPQGFGVGRRVSRALPADAAILPRIVPMEGRPPCATPVDHSPWPIPHPDVTIARQLVHDCPAGCSHHPRDAQCTPSIEPGRPVHMTCGIRSYGAPLTKKGIVAGSSWLAAGAIWPGPAIQLGHAPGLFRALMPADNDSLFLSWFLTCRSCLRPPPRWSSCGRPV
jgi:hypothetical protein